MVGGFDFVKAGKIAAVMLKAGRVGVRKVATSAYAEIERLANEETEAKKDFSAANGAVESLKTKQQGDMENGSV